MIVAVEITKEEAALLDELRRQNARSMRGEVLFALREYLQKNKEGKCPANS